MLLQVDFGAAQTSIGYRFYDISGAFVGARVTSGISAAPQTGVYVANGTVPSSAIGVYWDCADANYTASEDLETRLTIATNLDATVSSRNATTPPTAAAIRTEIDANSTKLDVATSTRAAAATALSTTQWTNGRAVSLDYLDVAVSSRSSATVAGSGAFTVTVTVTDGTSALQNATVRLTEGINSFTAVTNVSGVASFNLNAATFAIGITKAGYQFTPGTIAVSTSANFDKAMTAVVVTAPADPDQANGTLTTFDGQGAIAGNITLQFQMTAGPGANSFKSAPFTATSNSSGLLTIALRQGATYRARRANGASVSFEVPASSGSFALPEILGEA